MGKPSQKHQDNAIDIYIYIYILGIIEGIEE